MSGTFANATRLVGGIPRGWVVCGLAASAWAFVIGGGYLVLELFKAIL